MQDEHIKECEQNAGCCLILNHALGARNRIMFILLDCLLSILHATCVFIIFGKYKTPHL